MALIVRNICGLTLPSWACDFILLSIFLSFSIYVIHFWLCFIKFLIGWCFHALSD